MFVGTPSHPPRRHQGYANVLTVVFTSEAGGINGHGGGQASWRCGIPIFVAEDE